MFNVSYTVYKCRFFMKKSYGVDHQSFGQNVQPVSIHYWTFTNFRWTLSDF